MSKAATIKSATKSANGAKSASKTGIRTERRAIKYARMHKVTIGIGLILVTGLAVSLHHMASGIERMVGAAAWEAWAMAVVIDASYIGLEMAMLFAATPDIAREISRFAKPTIVLTTGVSAVMNAYAFSEHVQGIGPTIGACFFGCFIPVMLYVLMRVGSALHIGGSR